MTKLKTTLGILMISSAVTVSAMDQQQSIANGGFSLLRSMQEYFANQDSQVNHAMDQQLEELLIVAEPLLANPTTISNAPQDTDGNLVQFKAPSAQFMNLFSDVEYKSVAARPDIQAIYQKLLSETLASDTFRTKMRKGYIIGLFKAFPALQEQMCQKFEGNNKSAILAKNIEQNVKILFRHFERKMTDNKVNDIVCDNQKDILFTVEGLGTQLKTESLTLHCDATYNQEYSTDHYYQSNWFEFTI